MTRRRTFDSLKGGGVWSPRPTEKTGRACSGTLGIGLSKSACKGRDEGIAPYAWDRNFCVGRGALTPPRISQRPSFHAVGADALHRPVQVLQRLCTSVHRSLARPCHCEEGIARRGNPFSSVTFLRENRRKGMRIATVCFANLAMTCGVVFLTIRKRGRDIPTLPRFFTVIP